MMGNRIRLARTQKKLSLRAIGEVMGVTPQAVAQWEKSDPKFDVDKAQKLANALDVDLEWLIGRKGDDAQLIASEFRVSFGNRVPIIPRDHAVLFAIFNRGNFKAHDYSETLEPSIKPIGQGFAIRAQSHEDIAPANRGDILIFDNGLTPRPNDFVAAIVIDEYIRTVFALCFETDEIMPDGTKRLALAPHEGSERGDLLEKFGGATPVGVLVEYRRLYSEDERDRSIFKV